MQVNRIGQPTCKRNNQSRNSTLNPKPLAKRAKPLSGWRRKGLLCGYAVPPKVQPFALTETRQTILLGRGKIMLKETCSRFCNHTTEHGR